MPTKGKRPKKKAAKKGAPAAIVRLKPAQVKFVELVISGATDVEAYMEAYDCSRSNAESNAWRMKESDGVRQAIEAARGESWGEAVLSLKQKRAWLKMVIETPLSEVDSDSILCQERTYIEGQEETSVKVKMPDKLRAIELDAKLAGELAQDKAADKVAEKMGELATALKTIQDIAYGRHK